MSETQPLAPPNVQNDAARARAVPVVDWLLAVRSLNKPLDETLRGYAEKLLETGLPIDRITQHSAQLHAQILGRGIHWTPQGVEVKEYAHGIEKTDFTLKSPIWRIYEGKQEFIRQILRAPERERDYPISQELADEGYSDYLVFALPFSFSPRNALTFSTRKPEGFSPLDIATIRATLPAFGAVAELRHVRRTAAELMNTYLGRGAGERVLKGQIKRGDVEEIHAVILLCDLRNSTQLSEALPPAEMIDLLNNYFEIVGREVQRRGGEILKFIGDGLLAIFPCQRNIASDCDAADRAIWAAEAVTQALPELSKTIDCAGPGPLRIGIALHVGDVMYGNVGAANRLDFTVIGSAVNKAARLEELTKRLGVQIILSEEMMSRSGRLSTTFAEHGPFELRGINGLHKAFVPLET